MPDACFDILFKPVSDHAVQSTTAPPRDMELSEVETLAEAHACKFGLSPLVLRHNESIGELVRVAIERESESQIKLRHARAIQETGAKLMGQELDQLEADVVAAQSSHSLSVASTERAFKLGACNVGAENERNDVRVPQLDSPGTSSATRVRKPFSVKPLSWSQCRAVAQFEQIDVGTVNSEQVFASIPEDSRRVDTRVGFFRDRSSLVLPRIEARFMRQTGTTSVVDVAKLQSEIQPKSPSRPVNLEGWDQRVAENALVRTQRQQCAREAERTQLRARRVCQRDEMMRKASRKVCGTRHRTLLTFVVVALATESMVQMWRGFLNLYSGNTRASEKLQGRHGRGWRLVRATHHLLVAGVERRMQRDRLSCRSAHAFLMWCKLIRCLEFILRVQRHRRWNNAAELVKVFINSAWSGIHIRYSVKMYHKKVTLLQRAFKASARLRGTITQSIFMPSLWQIETAILGDLMALPRKVLQATLDQHCFVWDLSARLEEVGSRFVSERHRQA